MTDADRLREFFQDNITSALGLASDVDVAEGSAWYEAAHTFASGLATDYRIPLSAACGVIAALSPGCEWGRNLRLAEQLVSTGNCAHPYGGPINQARKALSGVNFHDIPKGPARKTRAFYECILSPKDAYEVCIDRHALSVAFGLRLSEKELKWLQKPGAYDLATSAYRSVALDVGLAANVVQAVTWCYWRRTKGGTLV